MIHRRAWAGVLFAFFACAAVLCADDWPQWRGPDRRGISKETGLLKEWPKDKGPTRAWTYRDAGIGFSSFAVVKGTLYTLGTREQDEIVLALNAADGKELWTARIGPISHKGNGWGDGPRSTPTIDGNLLYALGGQGELVCIDIAKKGQEVWRKNLITDFKGEMMSEWGYAESPLVDGEILVCTPGGPDGTLAALDKHSGAVKWRSTELKQRAPYSSMTVAEIHGVRQYIQTSAVSDKNDGFISGIAAKDGKLLWSAPLFKGFVYSISSSPPIVVDATVYVTCLAEAATTNCHRFAIDASFKVKDLYEGKNQNALKNNHGGVVLLGGNVYGYSERVGWVCQDFKTGKQRWSEHDALEGGGSIISADGRLYLFSEQGEVVLLDINPNEWNEVSRFSLPEKAKKSDNAPRRAISAHPVIANGKLYLRDQELIFCYDIRAAK